MSFRFSGRFRKPLGQGSAHSNAHCNCPIPGATSPDYGRFSTRNVELTVASPLRALLFWALFRRAGVAAVLEQLGRPRRGDLVDRIGGTKARVRLAVRDVGPEAALLEDDRLAAHGVVAQLLEGRRGRPTSPRLRLGEQ